jgi:hypothetical protein
VTMEVLHGNLRALAMIAGHWPGGRTCYSRDFDTICVQVPHGRQHQPQVTTRSGAPHDVHARPTPYLLSRTAPGA